ncbi:TPA: hypothetical protein N0F65_000859 [Lagenidium giganteum]|uniref:PDZ domain-containing protein n=1 Tax=Lagenidium giganteum TaxID=4803 RepID=A0AAV2YJ41_9STRA|nr:TPA: hypothetical protein N0F65_000859 [Lagenidium giganteum]
MCADPDPSAPTHALQHPGRQRLGMGETLTVRLFVLTQTHDVACDPRQPAKWLLQHAQKLHHSGTKRAQDNQTDASDELQVLYNRTRRTVIDLAEPIGKNIASMEVVDARTLLQTPDTSMNRATLPWLRSNQTAPNGADGIEVDSSSVLFFQQFQAFAMLGKRQPPTQSQQKMAQNKERLMQLLETYVAGYCSEAPPPPPPPRMTIVTQRPCLTCRQPGDRCCCRGSASQPQTPTGLTSKMPPRPSTPPAHSSQQQTDSPAASKARRASERAVPSSLHFFSKEIVHSPTFRRADFRPEGPSLDPSSESPEENLPIKVNASMASSDAASRSHMNSNSSAGGSPSNAYQLAKRALAENPLDEMENVFDIVFQQQAIGMKLGSDDSKQYAVVKECFDNSEAAQYPEIESGVVILAINGQEVSGIGLSRILYRLREAPRPVVVRFGRVAVAKYMQYAERSRMGTWG